MSLQQRFLVSMRQRSRLLDAARGKLSPGKTALPCFALKACHLEDNLVGAAPEEFHKRLVELIRNAKHRVSLASLYIGPAVDHSRELELLQALEAIPSEVDVKVLMDSNRGLRKVPIPGKTKETTSAAEAVAEAIHFQANHQVYLCQVLPNPLDQILPNPLNEVAGVFHIKAYIIDDVLILSGANLSEEYFSDRHDRYLQISNGGNGLVDFYAQLIDILCRDASDQYDPSQPERSQRRQKPIQPFWDSIHRLFTDSDNSDSQTLLDDSETVAVCVPTFHHPQITPPHDQIPTDVEVTMKLLEESPKEATVQIASAYLNPSPLLLQALQRHSQVDLLTAGRLSHGFRPKPKAGNMGKAWIPTVFDHLQYEALWDSSRLWHWQREGWTFHAKGLWIQAPPTVDTNDDECSSEEGGSPLLAAVVGSSNFGRRSFERDVESNLVLVFPPKSPFATVLQQEWKLLLNNSTLVENPKQVLVDEAPPLPLHVRLCFPFIKSFF
jgi:CDP-diacylglycerol---glycerol-3-phosphate 3-phosphatidyltransferase